MTKKIICFLIALTLLSIVWPDFMFSMFLLILFIMFGVVIALRVSDGVKFRDMPKLFYDIISHPLEKIIYPIFRTIILGAVLLGGFLFMGIFIPLLLEIVYFMKNGVWESLSLFDILIRFNKHSSFSYFDIPNWRGVEVILNWFFFEANATLSSLIIFIIYIVCICFILKNIDEKTASKLFDDTNKKNK